MAAETKQSFARRDFLQQIELDVQKKWEHDKVFEQDAPAEDTEKFFATFPYPYMNGLLHIGHAFSLTKAVFAAHYQRLQGKRVLFPFGFHCTGMPIQAAADKLKREYDTYGMPHPTFPAGRPQPKADSEGVIDVDEKGVTLVWKPPGCTGRKPIEAYAVLMRVGKDSDFKEIATVPHPNPEALAAQGKKVVVKVHVESGGCVYKVVAKLADGTKCPESKESDEVFVDAAPKAKSGGAPGKRVAKKVLAKTGDAAFQWEILASMGIEAEAMTAFSDPTHWLEYFPPLGKEDLKRFGCPIDFRRSFITTEKNPYYDRFIRWQFGKLKSADKIGFGKRPTIYSPLDGQACMDHDRSEGEGVQGQEYTAIKIELVELPKVMGKLKGKRVFLLAATLRPETMVGQTNCWILPEGTYGCFKAQGKDVFVCSHKAARNMSFQDILMPSGSPECLLEVKGKELIGHKVKAPTCPYDFVHLLPLLTIKMEKGTGIVTSVPSDSPDDYAAFQDLLKPAKRDHFGVKAEWVEPFKLIPIIDVEIDGEVRSMAAEYMCEKLKVQSQNDKEKLQEAHDVVYKFGFDRGVMTAGPFSGKPVKVAKSEFRANMVKDGQALIYWEPEKKIVSRSGDECVVALIDQWYLKYGEESWKAQIAGHLNGPSFNTYNERIKETFNDAIDWLKEWACSRSFGLGTRIPWDEQFIIESLSDSTIYMAYYTVAHMLQGGVFDGSAGSPEGIKPGDLTDDVWDYVFLNGPEPEMSKIKKPTLQRMRQEFRFWYPMDLRVSGKDLIQNHLTMSLYNHACVWEKEPDMWPKGMYCNGWLLVNSEKMSKSRGNFYTMRDFIAKYSADSFRLACANAGDTLEDANLEESVANRALLDMPVLLDKVKGLLDGSDPLQEGGTGGRFVDRWFENEMNRLVVEARQHYEGMYFREALRAGYFEFTKLFDTYLDICKAGLGLPRKDLAMRYIEWQAIVLAPICPHFCEHVWGLIGRPGTVLDARFPSPAAPVDRVIIAQGIFVFDKMPHELIKLQEKASKQGKPTAASVYVARSFPEWKVAVLEKLRRRHAAGTLPLTMEDDAQKAQWKEVMQELMQDPNMKPFAKQLGPFASFKRDEVATAGATALDPKSPFDEIALLTEHVPYLRDKLKIDLAVLPAEAAADAHKEAAANAQPGMPSVHFDGAKAPGGKPGAAPGPKKVAQGTFQVLKDCKALDAHLRTRSYMEDGPGPTAADAAQLTAVPASVSSEDYPHAARWHRHISIFSPEERARW